MKVKKLVARLLELDQEKKINFTFGAESGRSLMYGHSGDVDMDFDEDEGKIMFCLSFDEDNCDSQ